MEVDGYNAARYEEDDCRVNFKEQLHSLIATESLDFDSWTSIISETEITFPDNIEKISLIYDSFLSKFPLCHVYWKRYADQNLRLCGVEKAVEIYEQAVKSAPHSVPLWLEYCSFSMYAFEDPFDIRWLFKRGISYVGKDYLCHTLWDKFIEFECSQEQWSSIAHLFIQTIRFPSRKLHVYYKNFKKFTTLMEMEMEMDSENNCIVNKEASLIDDVAKTTEKEIYHVIKDLEDSVDSSAKSDALKRYISIGEQFYHKACLLDEEIQFYEDCIKRSFFHVKPLDDYQLEKWHQYLDFIEEQDDFDWSVKVYERCLIICANYPEFWMRYVDFTESNGGRELANSAVERASQEFFRDLPVIHQFSARFKEKIGDSAGARAEYHRFDSESNSYVENVIKEANMERRLGNLESASSVYERALKVVAENHKLHNGTHLYVQFSRLKYRISGSSDAAIDVIVDGIQHLPSSKLLLEELINFAMTHDGSKHLKKVDSVVDKAISSQALETKDLEDLSRLYLEFVDLWGTYDDTRKAWHRHISSFPNLIRTTSYNNPILSNESMIKGETKRGPFFIPDSPSPHIYATTPVYISPQDSEPKSQEEPVTPTQDSVSESQEDPLISTQDPVVPVPETKEDPMDSTYDSLHDSQEDTSRQPAELAESTQADPKNLPSDSALPDKEPDEVKTTAGNEVEDDDDDDAPPPGFSHPQKQPAQISVQNSQDHNQQMMQSYYQQQMMQQQLLQLQPYLQQQQQHEQMMIQNQQYQIQGGSDPVQVQQYILYMQQQQQQYIQQYQQQQYQQQLYNMQYAQILQQQQQQQVSLAYHQQGQGVMQRPPTASAVTQKLPASPLSQLQSPPATASTATSNSRITRSQSQRNK